ncbi:hypothetical protein G3480_19080 [Thiorhodococcus mannitoliphagus]|uniref:JAB domain-containing protein n=1 Tax=Thiorhodococcus mannitoliphagus TaxID=329406 RepID=A0A6P1E2Y6_9GAMM|nr:hypothetical protein [Thiorhodococcus mannitoliphagus]NEX22384.1 hypothetical protein [Thiorhodococcus mannitoliphagus]
MTNIIAHLNDAAFQSVLISSIETFPSAYIGNNHASGEHARSSKSRRHEGESFRLLFGQRMLKGNDIIFNVNLAVPMQTASRKKDMVSFSRLHFSRIREVTESFPYLEFVGTFHSHPCRKDEYHARTVSAFSNGDKANAIEVAMEYGDEILEVILGITVLDRHSKRPALMDGETIQSYCGRIKYNLSAFCTVGAADDEEDDDEGLDDFDFDTEDLAFEFEDATNTPSDNERDEEESDAYLMPVDRLICPIAAHGGDIFNRMEISEIAVIPEVTT